MKLLLTPMALIAFVLTGCDTEKPSSVRDSREITIEDIAWATDWNIYKWKISDLTDKELRQIQVVVIGPEGEVIKEGCSIGYESVLDPDLEIALAIKKTGADIEYKLRGGGSVTSSMEGLFTGNTWAFGPDGGIHQGLLVVATNSGSPIINSKSALESSGNKFCLKIIPMHSEKASNDGTDQPTTRAN